MPKGSIVINKEPTPWDFRYYIIGGLAFIIAQSFLIAGLLIQRRRKRSAEDALRQKTEELDQFFSLSPELLCIANTDGYFVRLNPAWERSLGYSREELLAKRFLDDRRASDVVRRVRALVKKEKQRDEPLDLNKVIEEVVALIGCATFAFTLPAHQGDSP